MPQCCGCQYGETSMSVGEASADGQHAETVTTLNSPKTQPKEFLVAISTRAGVKSMAISETVLILAGGTAVLVIVFGIRLAMRATGGAAAAPQSEGGEASAAGGTGAADVAGVIALPPLIFLRFLLAATVLEVFVPLPFLAAHALARYLASAALATG